MNDFDANGAAVIRFDASGRFDGISACRRESPEFKDDVVRAAGAFGKVRLASEQYKLCILRLWGMIKPLLETVIGKPVYHFPDGYCYRDKKLGGERAHRDDAPDGRFASWVATTESRFTFVPGSHVGVERGNGGFVKVEAAAGPWETLVVPAGDVLLFHPRLIHKVAAVDYSKRPQERVFFGVSTERPDNTFVDQMLAGEYVGAPSGEKQRAYPKLWDVNHPQKAAKHATHMNEYCVEERIVNDKAADKIMKDRLSVRKVAGKWTARFPKKTPQPVPRDWLRARKRNVKMALEYAGVNNAEQLVENHFRIEDPIFIS
jgi:hypothetical protein